MAGSGSWEDTGSAAFGASSIVECLPVVQGVMERKSSKVRTRGLQHFQPVLKSQSGVLHQLRSDVGDPDTFLSLMEDRRPRMIKAFGFGILIKLSATSVYTLESHYYRF